MFKTVVEVLFSSPSMILKKYFLTVDQSKGNSWKRVSLLKKGSLTRCYTSIHANIKKGDNSIPIFAVAFPVDKVK